MISTTIHASKGVVILYNRIEFIDFLKRNSDYIDMVHYLLSCSVQVDCTKNTTPLMIACAYSYYEMVKVLIELGADINYIDEDGRTALFYAKIREDKEMVDLLILNGEHCEGAWIDFFRSFLPNKYAVDKGFVFDSQGNVSDQIDIIIYDSLYAPLIFGTEAGEKFITAESVYAVFDSKPSIDKGTLEYTNLKVASVADLVRSSRGMIIGGKAVLPTYIPYPCKCSLSHFVLDQRMY